MNFLIGLLLSPLLLGIVTRAKALWSGRVGLSPLQTYFDIFKLLQKGAVYSVTTSWVFRSGPVVSLTSALVAAAFVPLGGYASPLAFSGDLLIVVCFLALTRFITALAALDTGSAFEGMGSSREMQFSALAEPALLLSLATIAKMTGTWSLSEMYAGITAAVWFQSGESLILVIAALLIVFLAENTRIPFDDPTTHLELTMIHEVMILDHSGPDLAFLELANAVKFWTLGTLLVGLAVPVRTGNAWIDGAACIAGLFVLAVIVGCIESITARLRLLRVPQMLVGATLLAALGIFVFLSREITS